LRIEDDNGRLEIRVTNRAEKLGDWPGDLLDLDNSVMLEYTIRERESGWSAIREEYIWTRDIEQLAKSFSEIKLAQQKMVLRSLPFRYNGRRGEDEFCRIKVTRTDAEIEVDFRIWDGQGGHFTVVETMGEWEFAQIADEFRRQAERFAVR